MEELQSLMAAVSACSTVPPPLIVQSMDPSTQYHDDAISKTINPESQSSQKLQCLKMDSTSSKDMMTHEDRKMPKVVPLLFRSSVSENKKLKSPHTASSSCYNYSSMEQQVQLVRTGGGQLETQPQPQPQPQPQQWPIQPRSDASPCSLLYNHTDAVACCDPQSRRLGCNNTKNSDKIIMDPPRSVLSVAACDTRNQSTQTMTLDTRMKMEMSCSYSFFSLVEDFDRTMIHVQKSFAPKYLAIPIALRGIWCHITYRILVIDHHDALSIHNMCDIMYFGHLTNITLILTWLYQCLSTFLSILAFFRPHHGLFLYRSAYEEPSALVRITWFIYSVALPAEFIVAIGYWIFEYNPGEKMTSINIYKHGIVALMLLLDGNVIGRIPLRIKHWRGVFAYGILYLGWSMVVSYLKLGNRHGVIYSFIDWRRDPNKAAAIGFFLLFLLGPIIFSACWLFSVSDGLCHCCSYNAKRRRVRSSQGLDHSTAWCRVSEYSDTCSRMESGTYDIHC